MSSDLLHIISYLAGFSLPFFGTVFGKLLIQLHIDVFIICQKRGTDLAQKLILFVAHVCVCVCVWMYRCPHVCVCTKKSPLNAPCSKTASGASHQTASALPFVLRASGVPPHFFTSLCHVLICSWSDFHDLQTCWSENSGVSIQWKPVEKLKNEKQEQSLSGRTSMHIFFNQICNSNGS